MSLFLFNFAKHHVLYLSCSNKPMHRQELRMSNHRVPMPPSQQPPGPKPNAKPQKIPRPSQSSRKLYHLLPLNQHLRVKPNRPMHPNKQLIQPIRARHRPSLLSRIPPFLHKVYHRLSYLKNFHLMTVCSINRFHS